MTIMYSVLCLVAFGIIVVYTQENAKSEIAPLIRECYNNSYLLTRDNRLPHNMITLIEIIQKIEDSEDYSMTLTRLSTALLHGFRQDGIKRKETLVTSKGIIPYAAKHYKFLRFVKLLRSIPGNAETFPNNSISMIERCTLHFMLSISIEEDKRPGEEAVCNKNLDNAYRLPRSINEESLINNDGDKNEDVEMLSPQQIQKMTNNKQREEEGDDPNSFYPDFPPNHPAVAQYVKTETSACPVLNGVVQTRWGDVAIGAVIAGIAAANEPQLMNIDQLMAGENVEPEYFENSPQLNNKWFATIAGDLAAVCRRQIPIPDDTSFIIGVDGQWNSTNLPRWYFLKSNENLELTRAELRGDIDGLIIANDINFWKAELNGKIRLSQILDMYYGPRGLIGTQSRACYRKELFSKVAPFETLEQQTFSAVKALQYMTQATIDETLLPKYSKKIVRQISSSIADSLKDDLSCQDTDRYNDYSSPFVNLIIVLDTNWPFQNIQAILSKILKGIEVGKFNSNFTLINGQSGDVMINTTNRITDYYSFNVSTYETYRRGFNMPESMKKVTELLKEKLDQEQKQRIGGGNADIVLFIPYSTTVQESAKALYLQERKVMQEEIPDTSIFVLTNAHKDRWSDFVENPSDVFIIGVSYSNAALYPIDSVISRLKQIPKRLINSECGSRYESQGSSEFFTDYVEPRGTNFYRIHPNYFFNSGSTPKITFQSNNGQLVICSSRELLTVNRSQSTDSGQCKNINSDTYTTELSCGDASLIHKCQPYYFSVTANSSTIPSFNCGNRCRYPDQISFKISYENLVCTSGVSSISITPVTISLTILFLIRQLKI